MKIKMVKMGMDIDETRNHRIRGIIPTDNNKYLFVEITQARRPDSKYFNINFSEYKEKYPNPEYIHIDSCFRVDLPKDYYDNYSGEFKSYDRVSFPKLSHTKENIIKVLQSFNKNITDIELVNDNYIDKYCEEKGFFRLYDNRLKHFYGPIEIKGIYDNSNRVKAIFLYTCFSANGTKYEEKKERFESKDELIKKYGSEKIETLTNQYYQHLNELKKSFNEEEEELEK